MKSTVANPNHAVVADVLVVGGGLAGTMAAITAAQCGAKVVMLVKGRVADSGSSSRAGGIIAASFGHTAISDEVPRDSAETHISDTLAAGCDLCSDSHVRALADEACGGILELERLGVEFSKTGDGRFHQLKAPGNSRPRACSVIGAGLALMTQLRTQLLSHGVRLIEDTAATRLLVDAGRVVGAQGTDVVTGAVSTVNSHSTVLATGGAAGLFQTISGDKRNTGDGLVLAYKAGAQLANCEFVEFTLIYRVKGKILKLGGLAPFLSRGCALVNKHGVRFMERYFPQAVLERAVRSHIMQGVVRETAAGRAPIYLDCTGVSDSVWEEFERSQGTLMLRQIRKAGCDYRKERIEVLPAAHSILAGLVTNAQGESTVKGLWAAGECATGVHGAARLSGNGLAACLVFGRRTGRNAANFAKSFKGQTKPIEQCAPAFPIRRRRRAPPDNRGSLRTEINSIAEKCLGVVREPRLLMEGLKRLRSIGDCVIGEAEAFASVVHIETRHLSLVGELMIAAALKRKESRGLHYRTDIASTKSSWRKWLVVQRDSARERPVWSYRTSLSADDA